MASSVSHGHRKTKGEWRGEDQEGVTLRLLMQAHRWVWPRSTFKRDMQAVAENLQG
jgi:hypothetical protein